MSDERLNVLDGESGPPIKLGHDKGAVRVPRPVLDLTGTACQMAGGFGECQQLGSHDPFHGMLLYLVKFLEGLV